MAIYDGDAMDKLDTRIYKANCSFYVNGLQPAEIGDLGSVFNKNLRNGVLETTLDTYFLPRNPIFNQSVLEFKFPDEIKLPKEDFTDLIATEEEKQTNKTLIECDAL